MIKLSMKRHFVWGNYCDTLLLKIPNISSGASLKWGYFEINHLPYCTPSPSTLRFYLLHMKTNTDDVG